MPAAPAAGVATDGSVGGGGTDDVPDDDAPSAVELERAFRADIRARLSTLTVPELKELCRDNHLRLGGNRAVLLARVGDWLATQDLLYSDDKRGAAPAIDPGDQGCLEVETFGINAASQYRDDRDPADKRPQAERDVARLLEAQQRGLDTLKSAFDHRCTRWLLPFAKPADWAEVDERTQSKYKRESEYSCATVLFDYLSDKFASR